MPRFELRLAEPKSAVLPLHHTSESEVIVTSTNHSSITSGILLTFLRSFTVCCKSIKSSTRLKGGILRLRSIVGMRRCRDSTSITSVHNVSLLWTLLELNKNLWIFSPASIPITPRVLNICGPGKA